MTTPASEPIQPPAPAPAEPAAAGAIEQDAIAPNTQVVTEPAAHGDALPAVRASTEVAKPSGWAHEFLEFGGDTLEIRVPTPQAMSALSLGMGKYVPAKMKNEISGLFIARHLSEDTYEHVYSRLMNPDDTGYNANTIGELIGALLNEGVEQFEKVSKAPEAVNSEAEK